MFQEGDGADVVFKCQDRTSFRAHSAVLSKHSDFFKPQVSDASPLTFSVEFEGSEFKDFIEFFYVGFENECLHSNAEKTVAMYAMASKYGHSKMKDLLESTICSQMSTSLCFAVLSAAAVLGASAVTMLAIDFFNASVGELMVTPEAEAFFQKRPDLASKVARRLWSERAALVVGSIDEAPESGEKNASLFMENPYNPTTARS